MVQSVPQEQGSLSERLADDSLQEAFPFGGCGILCTARRWGHRFCRLAHGLRPYYEQMQQTSSYHHPSSPSPSRPLAPSPPPLPLLELLHTLQGADDDP